MHRIMQKYVNTYFSGLCYVIFELQSKSVFSSGEADTHQKQLNNIELICLRMW